MNALTGGFQSAGFDGVSFIDRFAEQLSLHTDEADVKAGRGTVIDPGGDIAASAAAIRLPENMAEALFERICKRLGPQAV